MGWWGREKEKREAGWLERVKVEGGREEKRDGWEEARWKVMGGREGDGR